MLTIDYGLARPLRQWDGAPIGRTFAVPPEWLADTDRDRSSLRLRFPELFGGGYVSFRRLRASS